MTHLNRHHVVEVARATGIVPLFTHSDTEVCKNIIDACYKGGIRLFEFTNRTAFAHEMFGELRKHITENCPGMYFGVGSIVEPATAALFMQLGADFVVSPILNPDVVKICNRRKVACIPGCATSSEISQAEELGCDIVKIFPGSTLGASFVKSHLAPCPWSGLMATGGVEPTIESLKPWFDAGVYCVGIGSQLISKDMIESANYHLLEKQTSELVSWVHGFRSA